MKRREFLAVPASGLALAIPQPEAPPADPSIDFRYAPLDSQAAYCFPDDSHKSLVGGQGDLRIDYAAGKPLEYFATRVRFSVAGMEADAFVRQTLESPRVPIVHTVLERPDLLIELTTFATRRPDEGRVDNVIVTLKSKGKARRAVLTVTINTREELSLSPMTDGKVQLKRKDGPLFLLADTPLRGRDSGSGMLLSVPARETPATYFFRFPKEGQPPERLLAGLAAPTEMLQHARNWWQAWKPFGGKVNWSLPGRYQEFLDACARNIQQAREVKNGRKTFQVGPTVYRGLWIVDGNFLLESARYLGYDDEAQQGLEATWAHQRDNGQLVAAVQGPFWKDTGIAMFTMVRQAELSQDWTYFRGMVPNLLRAVRFLNEVRDQSIRDGGTNGGYRILAAGIGDGGLGGTKHELTNTIWVLAGLKAIIEAAAKLGVSEFDPVKKFYDELRGDLLKAARQEMKRHPKGFDFLPMLTRDDPAWSGSDEWNRPRPQVAQWALSHAIYPGLVFDANDPVVKGHIALMQASTEEDVPIETGWIPHEGLWTYNAPFASHVYLWAGEAAWASRTFTGFLNHASPLYCWREEQPLRRSAVANYVGDMPHNWASAECVLYLRHMLALEDGPALRLLAGITPTELSSGGIWKLEQTPSRFGRLNIELAKHAGEWRLGFSRAQGPVPSRIELPLRLADRYGFRELKGAASQVSGDRVTVEPGATAWSCTWRT